jgi:hypothetical protein
MKQRRGITMDKKLVISLGVIAALVLIAVIVFVPKGSGGVPDSTGLPKYALASRNITEAYLFARDNPDKLEGINCWCGCMQVPHNGRLHNRGLLDCYFKENGEYESHAAGCAMCIEDTLEVKDLYAQGMTKDQIKKIIDAEHTDVRQAVTSQGSG